MPASSSIVLIKEGFRIRAMKMLHLTEAQAEGFYYVHKERPFFRQPGEVHDGRSDRADDPRSRKRDRETAQGDGRDGSRQRPMPERFAKQFATNIERNAIHGSDGPETAAYEIAYFFNQLEIV